VGLGLGEVALVLQDRVALCQGVGKHRRTNQTAGRPEHVLFSNGTNNCEHIFILFYFILFYEV
jgi:hypothetical protein